MGLFDIFKRKKEEEIDVPPDLGVSLPEQAFPAVQEPSVSGRDIELVLTKLDLIDKKLDDLDRRIRFIEKIAKESK